MGVPQLDYDPAYATLLTEICDKARINNNPDVVTKLAPWIKALVRMTVEHTTDLVTRGNHATERALELIQPPLFKSMRETYGLFHPPTSG